MRIPLLISDLCRYGDYVDMLVAARLNPLRWLGFSSVSPAAFSA
jgi:hypothetical protein